MSLMSLVSGTRVVNETRSTYFIFSHFLGIFQTTETVILLHGTNGYSFLTINFIVFIHVDIALSS